jgi:MinD-like ATPase involved in chromosome partitioning or flagellar assembly
MRVIPIASGKGGVGKSLVAANLSVALAQAGKRVVLADLDLGGSNSTWFSVFPYQCTAWGPTCQGQR